MAGNEANAGAGKAAKVANDGYMHTAVSGSITQLNPPYWRLALPALGARYIGRYIQEFSGWKSRSFDAIAGAWMLGITAVFAYRTGMDMKNIFSESVAYEFDKKPEDVNLLDLMHSQNKTVVTARSNFIRINTFRAAVNSTFFASYLPGKSPLMKRFHEVPAADLGVGTNGVYLTMEILGDTRRFFEQIQNFVELKLNPKSLLGEKITSLDLMKLYQTNATDNDRSNMFDAKSHYDDIKNSNVIFERMADLMNHTYFNNTQGDNNNFILPKFIYLLGFNLIKPKKVKESLLYVEVANSYGISALKGVVKEVENGARVDDLITKYHVAIPDERPSLPSPVTNVNKFVEGIARSGNDNFVGRIKEPSTGPVIANQ